MSSDWGSKLPAMFVLARLYFGEDWPDFYESSATRAVDAFINGQPQLVDQLPEEIERVLLTIPTEELLKQLFVELDLLYDPPEMGDQTYRGWLEQVAARVQQVLNERG